MTDIRFHAVGTEVLANAEPSSARFHAAGAEVLANHDLPSARLHAVGLEVASNHEIVRASLHAVGIEVIYGEAPNERYGPADLLSPASSVIGAAVRGAAPREGTANLSSRSSVIAAYGLTGQVVVQATYSHAAGQIAAIGALTMRDLGNAPTVVEVTYTDTSTTPWSTATATASLPGVGSTVPRRVSSVSLPGISRYSQAMREAVERLNKLNLGNLSTTLDVFDEGIRHDIGDLIAVDFPALGLVGKPFRVTAAPEMPSHGRWRLPLAEHDPAAYSNLVQTADSTVDTVRVLQPADPSLVLGLSGSVSQGTITLFWTMPADATYSRTEIRIGGSDWETATEVFGGRATIYTMPVSAAGTYVFRAKHVLSDGRSSADSSTASVAVTSDDLIRGTDGAAGTDAVWPVLSSSSMVFPANASGEVSSYANASTSLTIMRGSVGGSIDDTSNWTLTHTTTDGLSASRSGSTFTVTALGSAYDTGTLTITATKLGSQPIVQVVSIAKSKSGAAGSAGAQGTRGSVETYRYVSSSAWSDSEAAQAIIALGITGGPVRGDRVMLVNYSAGYTESRYFNGTGWVAWQALIDGNLLVTGSVGAESLNADDVYALKLNINNKFIIGSDGIARMMNASDRTLNLGATGDEYVLQIGDTIGIEADGDSYFAGRLRGATGEFAGTLSAGTLDASAFDGIVMPAYTAAGTFTLAAPAMRSGWTRMDMRISIVSGGGGGGGGFGRRSSDYYTVSSGGGGGAGERRSFVIENITEGELFSIIVGGGGVGGSAATPAGSEYAVAAGGATGGVSQVIRLSTSTTIASASAGTGGSGGRYDYLAQGGSSGGTSGGMTPSWSLVAPFYPFYKNYARRADYLTRTPYGGKGGNSYYSPGGNGGWHGADSSSFNGLPGIQGSGGGGGSAGTNGEQGAGGKGGDGWIEITFFSGSLLTPADKHNALVAWCETFGHGPAPSGVLV